MIELQLFNGLACGLTIGLQAETSFCGTGHGETAGTGNCNVQEAGRLVFVSV